MKNFRAGRALRRRENFLSRHVRSRAILVHALGSLAGHRPDTSTNARAHKQNFKYFDDFLPF